MCCLRHGAKSTNLRTNMKRALFLLLLISTVCTGETTFTFYPTHYIFTLEGVTYATFLEEAAIKASPRWDMSQPPPISFKKVVELARTGFEKRLHAKPAWRVSSIELQPTGSPHDGKWYYVVRLEPQADAGHLGESFTMLVDFLGKPGKVELDRE